MTDNSGIVDSLLVDNSLIFEVGDILFDDAMGIV